MNTHELDAIIVQFDKTKLSKSGYFRINPDNLHDEGALTANKEGLQLFALELLKTARDADTLLGENEEVITKCFSDAEWIDQHPNFYLTYIHLLKDKISQEITPAKKNQWDVVGCLFLVITIAFLLITGVITVFGWFI